MQVAFDGTLLRLRAVDDWLDHKVKEFYLLTRQHEGLGELRFHVWENHPDTRKQFKRRFRPAGIWHPEKREFILLLGCEKMSGSYIPHGAFDLALQYKALLEQGTGAIHEHV